MIKAKLPFEPFLRYFIVFVWTLAVAVASPFLAVSTIFEIQVRIHLYNHIFDAVLIPFMEIVNNVQ